jgi:hypothetical protein
MSAMGRTRIPVPAVVLIATLAGGGLYLALRPDPVVHVVVRVHPLYGDEPLALNQGRYANPGGDGTFTIRDFQFFLSNLRLGAEDVEVREPNSYHLVRFDDEDGVFEIDLGTLPRGAYDRLDLGIGVDSAANNSIAAVGDLNPNGRMAWGWEIGYKFVLIEGGLEAAGARIPLVYHVGFDENYAETSVALDPAAFRENATPIDLCADLRRMFTGAEPVDMRSLSSVTFDGDDSRRLADNWADMVTACPPETRLAAR